MKEIANVGKFVKRSAIDFFKDYIWFFILICLFIKTFLFLGMVYSSDQRNVDFMYILRTLKFGPIYFCFLLLPLSFIFLFRKKGKIIFALSINFFISFLMVVDMLNFRAFGKFATMFSLSQIGLLDNLGTTVVSLINIVDIIFFLDIIAAIVFILIFNKKLSIVEKAKRNILAFILVFVFSIASMGFLHYMIDIRHSSRFPTKYLFFTTWTPSQMMQDLSPVGYHIYDIYTFWKDCQPVKLTDTQKNQIKTWYEKKQENLPDNKYKGIFKGKNVIFIEVESLEKCAVNQKISGQEVTPVLNKLIKSSIYFPNFYAQTWNGTSSDSMLLANTSIFPVRKGATFYRFPNNTYNSLPILMEELGYSTIAAEPDRGSYWNWMTALKSFGFDKCLDSSNFDLTDKVGMGLSDASFLKQLASVTIEQKQPFYMFMVTQTTHTPYNLPDRLRKIKMPASIDNTKLGGYMQSLHYTDEQIGIYLDALDKAGILDNTVVVIYGDHEGIHKFYPTEVSLAKPAQDWWINNYGKVPLVIYSKGYKGEVVDTIGGQIDTMPTIAYLMGIDEKKYNFTAMGRNLLKTKRNYAEYTQIYKEKYAGDADEMTKKLAKDSFKIADLIITSNYFKK
jgi:phosphoglycerol transferase MdoB-like AlkP superfamily enzyme